MTKKELIKALEKFDADAEVIIDSEGAQSYAVQVVSDSGDILIWIDGFIS